MEIRSASSNDIEYISHKLSIYFDETNSHFGFPRYKTDIELMSKVVSERVSDTQSEYKYLVALDEDEVVGFINILLSEETPEILVVIGDSIEIKKSLIQEALSIFKENGYTFVLGEVGQWDDTKNLIEEFNGEVVQLRYILKI